MMELDLHDTNVIHLLDMGNEREEKGDEAIRMYVALAWKRESVVYEQKMKCK